MGTLWRRITVCFIAASLIVWTLFMNSCSTSPPAPMAGDGLRLMSVGSLFEKAHNGNEFEGLLNTTGINNLDLDEDGHVDDIDVVEYGSGIKKGFSLTVDMGGGHIQQVAEITLHIGVDGWTEYAIRGNPQLYPYNGYFSARLQTTHLPFVVWAFMPNRVVYVPSYRYDPLIVRERRVVFAPRVYIERTVVIEKTTKVVVKKATPAPIDPALTSPNEGKASAIVKAPLARPTETQKQFQVQNPSTTTLSKGGFGGQKEKTETVGIVRIPVPPSQQPIEKKSLTNPTETQKQFGVADPNKDLGAKKFGDKQWPATLPPGTPPATVEPHVLSTPGTSPAVVNERKPAMPGTVPAPRVIEEKRNPAVPGGPAVTVDDAAARRKVAELEAAKRAATAQKAKAVEDAKKAATQKK